MSEQIHTDNPELEALFERYRKAPGSHVFAPLADACRKAGMLEEAIEICEKGVSTHPHYASGFVVRGKCYHDIGNADQAEASFERVLELDSHNLVALSYMGLMLAERGDIDGARQRFETILTLDPGNEEVIERMEALAEAVANPPEPQAVPQPPTDTQRTEVVLTFADIAAEVNDVEEVEEVERAEEEEFVGETITLSHEAPTPDVLATMTLAEIYAAQGYRKKAVKIYRELLATDPDAGGIREKLRALESGAAPGGGDAGGGDDRPARETPKPPTEPAEAPKPWTPSPDPKHDADRGATQFKRWLENFNR